MLHDAVEGRRTTTRASHAHTLHITLYNKPQQTTTNHIHTHKHNTTYTTLFIHLMPYRQVMVRRIAPLLIVVVVAARTPRGPRHRCRGGRLVE